MVVMSSAIHTDSITIINTLDEDPEYTSLDGSKYQYQHGNVNVSKDQLSIGIVFKTVHSTALYDPRNHCIIGDDGEPNDIVHYHLGTNLNVLNLGQEEDKPQMKNKKRGCLKKQ